MTKNASIASVGCVRASASARSVGLSVWLRRKVGSCRDGEFAAPLGRRDHVFYERRERPSCPDTMRALPSRRVGRHAR